MKQSEVQAMKELSKSRFKIGKVNFTGFQDIDAKDTRSDADSEDDFEGQIDVWADFTVDYEGDLPDSYRTLNSILMDWVEDNEDQIKKLVNPKLKGYLEEKYPNLDTSDLDQDFDDYIWEDQVDYMPVIDEDNTSLSFSVELVLDIDDEDSEES